MSNAQENRFVGPVIKNSEVGEAVVEAVYEDNSGRKIEVKSTHLIFESRSKKSVSYDLKPSQRCSEGMLLGRISKQICPQWKGLFELNQTRFVLLRLLARDRGACFELWNLDIASIETIGLEEEFSYE